MAMIVMKPHMIGYAYHSDVAQPTSMWQRHGSCAHLVLLRHLVPVSKCQALMLATALCLLYKSTQASAVKNVHVVMASNDKSSIMYWQGAPRSVTLVTLPNNAPSRLCKCSAARVHSALLRTQE